MWLVRGSLKNPYLITVVALLFLVAGLVSVAHSRGHSASVQEPRRPGADVLQRHAGSAIDRNITTRMALVRAGDGRRQVESKSMVGVSIVRLIFRDDIDPAAALTEVNSLSLSTLKTLPPGTLPPIVRPFDPTATCRCAS
jgi:multidrug efflux pump subunit AcrB